MPAGELFIKTKGTGGSYVDAYNTWGLSLEDEGLSRLITPRPHKSPVTNKNVTASGAYVIANTIGKEDERTISVPMHITARTKADFWTQYEAFCADVLARGTVYVKVVLHPTAQTTKELTWTLVYQDAQNFTEFIQEMAKFDVVFYESNYTPEIVQGT